MSPPEPWQVDFIDGVGALADLSGLPPSFVRVFAWMVVCDPPHQSVDQLRQTLGLSRGAISMATATLVRMGFCEKISVPGQRRLYYRFNRAGWSRMLQLRVEGAAQMRAIAEEALASAPTPPERLAEMRDVYAWFEGVMSDLLTGTPWATGHRQGRGQTVRGRRQGSSTTLQTSSKTIARRARES